MPNSSPTFWDLFTPKLLTVLREGYSRRAFRADLLSGLTVAIVALPLSMAIAIASGVTPERGLIAAIVGGFLVSALGGSRFQIGGPAGAFIVLVSAVAERHGVAGVTVATFLAGIILLGIGYSRLGTYIRLVPFPVTVGFTAGIALIIAQSQIKEVLGVPFQKLVASEVSLAIPIWGVVIALLTVAVILLLKRFYPQWPG
ncbi:MAG: hypothetical protein KDD60_03765, partial [Bdellovibrionales bacterium]|nr:hypothetical protein [Bdellovibrionales bacterium]